MSRLNPYLSFPGTCEEAFSFYARQLGGKIVAMMTFEGTPMADQVPPDWAKKIIHGQIEIDGTVLMASDASPAHYEKPQGVSLCISPDDVDRAEQIFGALAEGGTVTMPLQQTFWATRFGMLTDKFDIRWLVNCDSRT